MYLKDPDGALIMAKTLSVQRCTLAALDGHHLVYVAEEAEPGRGAQLKHFFLNDYRDDSACSGAILQDCRIAVVKKGSRRCLLFTVQSGMFVAGDIGCPVCRQASTLGHR